MTRICPLCLNTRPVAETKCDCGYTFDTGNDEITVSPTVEVVRQAVTEDEYRTFYEAQLERVQLELKNLIARYGRSGWTPSQRDEIQAAIKKVDTAKTDLAMQIQRTEDAKRHLDAAKNRVEIRKINVLVNKKI